MHRFPLRVRYAEVDQQGVVFNGWYLTYFDEAMADHLAAAGYPYPDLQADGFDVQLVRTELEWRAGLRHGDAAEVAVATAAVGRTSFTLAFAVERTAGAETETTCTGTTVYVVIATDGTGKRPIPDRLRRALAEPG
jgi:acyl-CoA thioester hydrolase